MSHVIGNLAAMLARSQRLRRLTRTNLLILCYHGFAIDDEAQFRPSMFMTTRTFAARMALLAETRLPVFSLSEAVQRLASRELPPGAVAITADDGWRGTIHNAKSVLKPYGFPITNYITTHYVGRGLPVSNMMLSYLLWKGQRKLSSMSELNLSGELFTVNAGDAEGLRRALTLSSERLDATGRDEFNQELAAALEVDYAQLRARKLFHLMDEAELKQAADAGVEIQLHGDRHLGGRTLDDEALFKREITVNREKLAKVASSSLDHFCYPSGAHSAHQERWLKELEIRSATTCQPGLNGPNTNLFQLRRYLDREDVSINRFALELAGIPETFRRSVR